MNAADQLRLDEEPTGGDPYNYAGKEARTRQAAMSRALRDPTIVGLFLKMTELRIRLRARLWGAQ